MRFRKLFAFLMAVMMVCAMVIPASAATAPDALTDTAKWLQKNVPSPTVSSIGGEWAVIGLCRSEVNVPQKWYDTYYNNVVDYVKACGGVLHKRKYTEYSRVVLALTAIGKDPTNVAGYDLTAPLNDYDKTVWQGVNGPIWALIALDSGNYDCSVRQKYIDCILEKELPQGGWTLSGDATDSDMTGMALQALANYQDQPKVKAAIERGLTWVSKNQNADGGFSTYGEATCESTAQILVALCTLGIDPEDSRFLKNGNSAMDSLLSYYTKGKGFSHLPGGSSDGMATEQAFYALVAADRAENGKAALYEMRSKVTFSDIVEHKNQQAIENLAGKGIINGTGNGTFAPNRTMTRAEFCTIVVKALGIKPLESRVFSDVPSGLWYSGYVGAANSNGIVNGVGNSKFNPNGTITRQEAATMVVRAAKVLGLNTAAANADATLGKFSDSAKVASYAKTPLAYCYNSGILEAEASIQPTKAILRCEVAQMVYNLLKIAGEL